jgi:hypothetical protein
LGSRNPRGARLLAAIAVAVLGGCAAKPSADAGRAALESRLADAMGDAPYTLQSFQTTGAGLPPPIWSSTYAMPYRARVLFPQGFRPGCIGHDNLFTGYNCMRAEANAGMPAQPVGAVGQLNSAIIFRKTPGGGWAVDGVGIKLVPAPH